MNGGWSCCGLETAICACLVAVKDKMYVYYNIKHFTELTAAFLTQRVYKQGLGVARVPGKLWGHSRNTRATPRKLNSRKQFCLAVHPGAKQAAGAQEQGQAAKWGVTPEAAGPACFSAAAALPCMTPWINTPSSCTHNAAPTIAARLLGNVCHNTTPPVLCQTAAQAS